MSEIIDTGAAASDARLRTGDKILVCNGESLAAVTHAQAVGSFMTSPSLVQLTIARLPRAEPPWHNHVAAGRRPPGEPACGAEPKPARQPRRQPRRKLACRVEVMWADVGNFAAPPHTCVKFKFRRTTVPRRGRLAAD